MAQSNHSLSWKMELTQALQQIQPSYIREILMDAQAEGVISLAGGLPDGNTFPIALMDESLTSLPQNLRCSNMVKPPVMAHCLIISAVSFNFLSIMNR